MLRSSAGRMPVDRLLHDMPSHLTALPALTAGADDVPMAWLADPVVSCLDTTSPAGATAGVRPNAVADDFRDSLSDTSAALGRLSPGGSVRGSIETSGDHDVFAISLTAGQTYTFNLTGGGTGGNADTVLRLLNGSGTQLAVNDDFGSSLFSRITYTATSSGTFYLDAAGYGRETGSYTLSSTGRAPTPTPTPTDDFRDSLTDTTAPFGQVGTGTPATGRIETGGDRDVFSINLTAGKTYTIDLASAASGGLADPMLRLLNGSGTQLAMNDDFGGGRNSQITFQATSTGTYYLEAKGYGASQTGAYTLNARSTDTTPTPPPTTGGFDIVINYSGDAQYQSLFDRAAARWEQVITTDLPDFNSRTAGRVDDLVINAEISFIDGAGTAGGNILGQAGPTELRSGSLLPAVGQMQFDSFDFASLPNAFGVIMHEMGHVLGLGTLWSDLGLEDNFRYTGANALREYRTISGNGNAAFVPVEEGGGPGTAGGHWDEEIFRSELMTGYASGAMELSRMTIGSLADMGYGVNYAAADPYTLPGRVSSLMDAMSTSEAIFGIV